jgi:hypothetical protein
MSKVILLKSETERDESEESVEVLKLLSLVCGETCGVEFANSFKDISGIV